MPPPGMQSLIAVMPVENLTGMPVPVDAVRRSLVQSMKRKGLNILGDDVLEKFLERHRIRYTGGLNRDLGKALREETGTNAVLFASLELFDESSPPKAALAARLVATHENCGYPLDGGRRDGRKRRSGIPAPRPDR